MNYIKHLNEAMCKLSQEDSLNPAHVSLYLALFCQWNMNRFNNPISICRSETMFLSKIGSKTTYHKCLMKLHELELLRYVPSHNPLKGSTVHMFNFETTKQTTRRTTTKPTTKTTSSQVVVPSIKKINNTKQSKQLQLERADNLPATKPAKSKGMNKPSLKEVEEFFTENQHSAEEAQRFYFHFESNGWLVGGKAKMKNWQAAAHNWMRRALTYNHQTNHLHAPPTKNYSEPL